LQGQTVASPAGPDYDNDGWLDIFATCYQRTLDDVVRDMQGRPIQKAKDVTRLFRNRAGKKFEDVSKEMGVDKVFATMGSDFADFDNDGFLDFYLGTGEPSFATLVPNRMMNIQACHLFDHFCHRAVRFDAENNGSHHVADSCGIHRYDM
jgi:hypothetical protein